MYFKHRMLRSLVSLVLCVLLFSSFCGCGNSLPEVFKQTMPAQSENIPEEPPVDLRISVEYHLDPDGVPQYFTKYEYDKNGLFQTKAVWSYRQDDYFSESTYSQYLCSTTTELYDAAGNLLQSINDDGEVSSYTYDAAGNLIQVDYASGSVTTYKYDSAGNLTHEYHGSQLEKECSYDNRGNCIRSVSYWYNGDQQVAIETTINEYDDQNRIISYRVEGADDIYGKYVYNKAGKLEQYTFLYGEMGGTVTYHYDEKNRLIKEDADTYAPHTITYSYDDRDNLIEQCDSRFGTTRYIYEPVSVDTLDESWKQIYLNYLQTDFDKMSDDLTFYLTDMDNNGVPEMYIHLQSHADGRLLLSIHDNAVVSTLISAGGSTYCIPEQKLLLRSTGFQGVNSEEIFQLRDGQFVALHSGSWNTISNKYYWNRQEVSFETYTENCNSYFNKDIAFPIGHITVRNTEDIVFSPPSYNSRQIIAVLQ